MEPALANRLVGVIDLKDGRAVHAVAGNRKFYSDVPFCVGDPLLLAKHYVAIGLSRLYLADLDSISGQPIQSRALESILHFAAEIGIEQVLIDIGWCGTETDAQKRALTTLTQSYPIASWIAATECCESTDALASLGQCVSNSRTWLGLDYRDGVLITRGPSEGDWIDAALDVPCAGVVILDISAVGTGGGPVTAETCRRIRDQVVLPNLYSGGGIRNAQDMESLIRAGCSGVLVATALFPAA